MKLVRPRATVYTTAERMPLVVLNRYFDGIAEFDQEFYAYTLLPSGRTVYEETHEQVAVMIQTGMPGQLMLGAGPKLQDSKP